VLLYNPSKSRWLQELCVSLRNLTPAAEFYLPGKRRKWYTSRPQNSCSRKLANHMFKIRKGLDLPIAGVPEQHVSAGASVRHVAILGDDYVGMRPSMLVQQDDRVIKGQAL